MDSSLSLPWRLHQANLALGLDIDRLLHEGARRWLEAGGQLYGEAIAGHAAEAQALRPARDWPGFATLPADAFWRQLQVQLSEGQALAQVAMTVQTALANGLEQALRTWGKDRAAALGEAMRVGPAGGAEQSRPGRAGGQANGDER